MQLGQMGGLVMNSPRCNTHITCRVCAHCVNLCPVNISYYILIGCFRGEEVAVSKGRQMAGKHCNNLIGCLFLRLK